MKFALIFEKSLQKSFSVKNQLAYKLNTDTIYEWHSSIKVGNIMTSMGPFTYPFIFEGDYLNWSELNELPKNDYDIVLCALENNPDKFNVATVRKTYPNALIIGTIKELYFIRDYQTRVNFFNECDAVCIPYKESFYTYFPKIKQDVNKEIHWVPQGYNIDFLYDNFYKEEREETIFSYVAPHAPRRGYTQQFAEYLSKKYNVTLLRKDLTRTYDRQWHDFFEFFSTSTFCINLDPEPQFGQQGVQSAILGVINLGGLNDSHFNLFPETCHNNLDQLESTFEKCIHDIDFRYKLITFAYNQCTEIYSFDAVHKKLLNIINNI